MVSGCSIFQLISSFILLNTVIKKGQYDDIVKSYVDIIMHYLKIQLKIAKEGLKSGNLTYDTSYIKNAYKYGTECSNIGIEECMIMMPNIYKVLELWTAQQNSQIEQTRKGTFRNGDTHEHTEKEE